MAENEGDKFSRFEHVLSVSPGAHHVRVRGLRERRDIPVAEADSNTDEDTVVTWCRDSARGSLGA